MSLIEDSSPARVEVGKVGERFLLQRGGKPLFVKGAGGFSHLERLAEAGGNAVRTWGIEQTEEILEDVQRLGLLLCAGLWMEPPRRGFDYSDASKVEAQFSSLKEQVDRLKDVPELLLWGVGNELEMSVELDESVWRAVESVAAYIKSVDPLHPVMTVLSCPNEGVLELVDRLCPSLDFVGINSYGDIGKVSLALEASEWRKPYLVTEWGSNGAWEVESTPWGAEIEPTSTEKAVQIRERYRCLEDPHGLCMGGFVFLWGNKQERTHTWFSLLSEEGLATEAVEALAAVWRGREETRLAPQISEISINGRVAGEGCRFRTGEEARARFQILRGLMADADVRWWVAHESNDRKEGGDPEDAPESIVCRIEKLSANEISFSMPHERGAYRLFLEVTGSSSYYATANFPFWVG